MQEIIEHTHRLINRYRRLKGFPPYKFRETKYDREFFMETVIDSVTNNGTEAPYCQCAKCQAEIADGKPENAKRVTRNMHGWMKYGRGHKPADGKFHSEKRDSRLDGIPTESLFTVKVYTAKQYAAKSQIVDDRILKLLDEVAKGDIGEITCIYPEAQYSKVIFKQINRAIESLEIKVSAEKIRDHIKLVKTGESED